MKKEILNNKTYEELRKIASKKKIEGRSKMKKSELIKAILKESKKKKSQKGSGLYNTIKNKTGKIIGSLLPRLPYRNLPEGEPGYYNEFTGEFINFNNLPKNNSSKTIQPNNIKEENNVRKIKIINELPSNVTRFITNFLPVENLHTLKNTSTKFNIGLVLDRQKIFSNNDLNFLNSSLNNLNKKKKNIINKLSIDGNNIDINKLQRLYQYFDVNEIVWNSTDEILKDSLPINLKSLELLNYQNPLLPGVLPINLKIIEIKYINDLYNFSRNNLDSYDLLQPNILPNSLETLIIVNYNKIIGKNVLPQSLKTLELTNYNLEQETNLESGVLPENLKSLTIHDYKRLGKIKIKNDSLPKSLVSFDYSGTSDFDLAVLPRFLKELTLDLHGRIESFRDLTHLTLLETLIIYDDINSDINFEELPNSIISLKLNGYNNIIKPNTLPPLLKILKMNRFNQPIGLDELPHSIRNLELNYYNNIIKPNTLPPLLKILKMNSFNQPIGKNVLPKTLKILDIRNFTGLIDINNMPADLEVLMMSPRNKDNLINNLPKKLKELGIKNNYRINNFGDFIEEIKNKYPELKIFLVTISSEKKYI